MKEHPISFQLRQKADKMPKPTEAHSKNVPQMKSGTDKHCAKQYDKSIPYLFATLCSGFFTTLPLHLFFPFSEFLFVIAITMICIAFIVLLQPVKQTPKVQSQVLTYQPPINPPINNTHYQAPPKVYIPCKKILLLSLLLLATGCALLESDEEYVDDKSWNQPADWEQNSLGVGF